MLWLLVNLLNATRKDSCGSGGVFSQVRIRYGNNTASKYTYDAQSLYRLDSHYDNYEDAKSTAEGWKDYWKKNNKNVTKTMFN